MMTTTKMTMPNKIWHDCYSYREKDRFFLNNSSSSSSSNGSGQDCSCPTSVHDPLQGISMPRGVSANLQECRVLGSDPSGQSCLTTIPRHDFSSSGSAFNPLGRTLMPRAFALDFRVVGTDPSIQRTSRNFDIEPRSLRIDTIERPRFNTTTPSNGAEANDAPLDLSTPSADNLGRTLNDQIFPSSRNSTLSTYVASNGAYDQRPESGGRHRSTPRAATPQLPLFVNLENSRLHSIQLGLRSRSGHDTLKKESHETKLLALPDWTTTMEWAIDPEVEAPRKQKSDAIDRLRAHLERRQEARPATSTAYASLSQRLAAIEATGTRYEARQDGMFGVLSEASEPKEFFICTTEVVDTQGRSRSSSQRETRLRHLEVNDQSRRFLSGVNIEELQPEQQGQRLNEMNLMLQSGPYDEGERRCAAPTQNEETSQQRKPSGVSLERHPPSHSHAADDHSMVEEAQTDIHTQDPVLSEALSDHRPSRRPDFGFSKHAADANLTSLPCRTRVPGTESEPDSPSSHSMPGFTRRSDAVVSTPCQGSQRFTSADIGFPSSQNLLTKKGVMVTDRGGSGGWRMLEACSPDQSTDSMNYKAENLPSIIASARLDDDCEFLSSFAETRKETSNREHHHQPMERSTNARFRNRRNATLSGTIGSGKGSSPEPPSSTFEDEPLTDKNKDEDTNTKSTESAIPCKICQDVANGFHYGVWSCEGCKAFFKRSITGSARYVCPADNNCTINRLRKKSCQACRLRKCYEYGMSPGNCRGETGSKARKRKLHETNLTDREEVTKHSVTSDHGRTGSSPSNQSSSGDVFVPDFRNQPTVTEPVSGSVSFLQHLVDLERPIRFADFMDARTMMNSEECERILLLTSITKLVNQQLMDIVTWALSLTGFSALNLKIRTHLLISSWSDILLWTSAFYSLQCTNAIVVAPNLHLTKERCETIGMTALYNRMMAIVRLFQQQVLTHNEMLLMQAMLLFNGDLIAPRLLPRLDEMRASLMQAWYKSCTGGQGQGHDDRSSQLLLLLPHIRHCSIIFLRFLADLRRDSRIPIYGLLQEVTDSCSQLDQVPILERLVAEEVRL